MFGAEQHPTSSVRSCTPWKFEGKSYNGKWLRAKPTIKFSTTRRWPTFYRKKVGELQTLLVSAETRTQAMESIRSLIERIEVFLGKTRGNPDVIVVGALAQILAFGQTKSSTATSLEDDGRVLMVARAGFEPASFRL